MSHTVVRPAAACLLVGTLAGASACADAPLAPRASRPAVVLPSPSLDGGGGSEGRGVFQRYVAIGTSVSMGWQSDGVLAASQETSWPAQLARLAHRELALPRVAFPGCGAPLTAPLASGLRVSGEPAAAPLDARACAPNDPGVTLPAGNLAVAGARTDQALATTPGTADPAWARLYARVLPAGASQVTAMEALRPKVVSVELGANEVLGARDGAVVPGQTVVPVAAWAPRYREVVERVAAVAKHAVLVGLIADARHLPGFRTGGELWEARATFAPFHVTVGDDCGTAPGRDNVLFVPVRVPQAAAEGAARARAGAPPAVLSCANAPPTGPDGRVVRDYVLSAAEVATLDAQLAAMNALVRAEAERRGFAYFDLDALYARAYREREPFSAVRLLTSPLPYGPLVSLDGVHPSAAGAAVLAQAAALALDTRYALGIASP